MGKDATFQFESRETLFPIYLWRFRIDDHVALNRGLLKEIAKRAARRAGRPCADRQWLDQYQPAGRL